MPSHHGAGLARSAGVAVAALFLITGAVLAGQAVSSTGQRDGGLPPTTPADRLSDPTPANATASPTATPEPTETPDPTGIPEAARTPEPTSTPELHLAIGPLPAFPSTEGPELDDHADSAGPEPTEAPEGTETPDATGTPRPGDDGSSGGDDGSRLTATPTPQGGDQLLPGGGDSGGGDGSDSGGSNGG